MATVYLPSLLTQHTGGLDRVEIDAGRVGELVAELVARYPGIAETLGQMTVAVDGDIYTDADYIVLKPDSEVYLVPRVSGG